MTRNDGLAPGRWGVARWNGTLLATGLAGIDVAIHLVGPSTSGWAGPHAHLGLVLVVDFSVVLLARYPRHVAGLALVITSLVIVGQSAAPGLFAPLNPVSQGGIPTAVPPIIWYLVRYEDRATALAVVPALAVLGGRLWSPSWEVTPVGLLVIVVPALLALYARSRSELMQSLQDRARRSEREALLLAERARLEERSRLATEMHDIVSHRITLVVLRAGALGVSAESDSVREAAEDIRKTGTQALEELHDVVGVLHGRPPTNDPNAVDDGKRLRDLDPRTLVAESEAVGVPIDLHVEGDAGKLSLPVLRTVYRVVQEGLTNVRKHAPGADVRVEVAYAVDGAAALVQDSGPKTPVDPELAGTGAGFGLEGLRRRVEAMGGRLETGAINGGFRLRAVIPEGTTPAVQPT